ncbi:hypothetical protein GUJ93_ZPchr0001g29383 [Zizania palustris]|uniref:Uncharacterized protein n=1 Tax=Zizania palustris TaxID=103762 RepID=A0A8J5RRH9_ZIZPA|nr:hypothetical protein GUJ93_ZPchr0001g29383 [Zizania palustris]
MCRRRANLLIYHIHQRGKQLAGQPATPAGAVAFSQVGITLLHDHACLLLISCRAASVDEVGDPGDVRANDGSGGVVWDGTIPAETLEHLLPQGSPDSTLCTGSSSIRPRSRGSNLP